MSSLTQHPAWLALMGLVLAACAPGPGLRVERLEAPAPPGAFAPTLSAGNRGIVSLSWVEPRTPRGRRLRLAERDSLGWRRPRTIVELADAVTARGTHPGVHAGPCGMYLADWREPAAPGVAAPDPGLWTAVSIDGGWTWTAPDAPTAGAERVAPVGVSTFPSFEGVGLVWLRAEGSGTELRAAVVGGDGRPVAAALLDAHACRCCPAAAVHAALGAVVAYRAEREADGRTSQDIVVRRRERQAWGPARVVHADGWAAPGCPGHGPALAARADTVVVVWRSASPGRVGVSLAWSFDAGEHFGAPITLGTGAGTGQPVVAFVGGSAVAAWEEAGAWRVARVPAAGTAARAFELLPASAAVRRLTWVPDGAQVLAAWEETAAGGGPQVTLARLRLTKGASAWPGS